MKKIILLILMVAGGCVNNDIAGDKVEKTKSITVWDSDLELHYDWRTEDKVEKVEEAYLDSGGIGGDEGVYTWKEESGTIAEKSPTDSLEALIVKDLERKVAEDEERSKERERLKKIEEKSLEERKLPKKVIWIVVLTALASFGGYFISVRKKEEDEN